MQGDEQLIGSSGAEPAPSDAQDASDRNQTASDSDQTMSDRDQTAADADQTASERDQLAADRDQELADLDQEARAPGAGNELYARGRRGRSQSSLERDLGTEARTDSARLREANALQRDAVSEWRDDSAVLRDQAAAQRDTDDSRFTERPGNGRGLGMELLVNAARGREVLAAFRVRAAAERESAARDRRHAAEDRWQAALDRKAAAAEIAHHGIDHLTGTLRRQVGLMAMQRELDRTARTTDRLVAAFIDVDGLKTVNDAHGHTAGDALLQAVAGCVKEQLRSYDLIARYGGDEFVCTISGLDMPGVGSRFEVITEELSRARPGASISVGLAEREPDEALDHLIDRADAVLQSTRQSQRR